MSTQHEIDCFEKEIAIMRSLPPHPNVLPCTRRRLVYSHVSIIGRSSEAPSIG